MHGTRMMPDVVRRGMTAAIMATAACSCAAQSVGWDGRHDLDLHRTEFVVSPFTHHFSGEEEHSYVWLVGASSVAADGWSYGASLFSNSFGQPSAYAFIGHEYIEPWGLRSVYYAWTAGLIYGYKGEHKDEIKPNLAGFSPGLIPRVGYQMTPNASFEVASLGFAALMFNLNFKIK